MNDVPPSSNGHTSLSASEKHELRARSIDIPMELFKDKRLSPGEKFLVVVIDMLDNEADYCFASNSYLAGLLDISVGGLANMLTTLRVTTWLREVNLGDGRRHLTTLLRDNRDRLSAVHQMMKGGSSNDEGAVHHLMNVYNSSGNELRREEEDKPLQIFRQTFSEFCPSAFQQDLISQGVRDLDQWVVDVRYWAGNGYNPKSITKLLEMHARNVEEKKNPPLSNTMVVVEDGCAFCEGPMPNKCPWHEYPGGPVKKRPYG